MLYPLTALLLFLAITILLFPNNDLRGRFLQHFQTKSARKKKVRLEKVVSKKLIAPITNLIFSILSFFFNNYSLLLLTNCFHFFRLPIDYIFQYVHLLLVELIKSVLSLLVVAYAGT